MPQARSISPLYIWHHLLASTVFQNLF